MVRGKTKDSPWPYTLGVCNWCEANFALIILPILPRKTFHKLVEHDRPGERSPE